MDGMTKLRFFRPRTAFAGGHPAKSSSGGDRFERVEVVFAEECLRQLEHDLGVTADERAQWTAFSRNVLVQIERVSAARQAAWNSVVSDPAHPALERELVRQVIVTPELLSRAAKDLYAVLTPEQQRVSGEKLLTFHRRLVG